MSTLRLFRFPELSARTKRTLSWFALFFVALLVLMASTGAMAQTTTLDTSLIDGPVCSILKVVKKFAFYALCFTVLLVGIAVMLNESKGMFQKALSVVIGVWVILNAVILAASLMPGIAASFCST